MNSEVNDQIEFAAFYRRSLARIPEREFATGRGATRAIAPDEGDARNNLAGALRRSPARFAGSRLDAARAELARDLVVRAACLALRHAHEIDYVRGARRWEGIDRGLRADRGEYPRHADCSSFASWVLWQALSHFGVADVVNGMNWQTGYVGTLLEHGRPVTRDEVRVGDLAFYQADDSSQQHVAVCLGGGKVVSHGNDDGPRLLELDYRDDLRSIRRYI